MGTGRYMMLAATLAAVLGMSAGCGLFRHSSGADSTASDCNVCKSQAMPVSMPELPQLEELASTETPCLTLRLPTPDELPIPELPPTQIQAEPEPEPKPEPQPEPKPELKPEPKPQSKPEPSPPPALKPVPKVPSGALTLDVKAANEVAQVNGQVVFNITLRNQGSGPITSVQLSAELSGNLSVSTVNPAGASTVQGQTVEFEKIENLAPTALTYSITASVKKAGDGFGRITIRVQSPVLASGQPLKQDAVVRITP